jgi:hypothetical protein
MMKITATVTFCVISVNLGSVLWAADAASLLREADRYADAGNWVGARDLYAQAEQAFRESGDTRNQLYAKFRRMHRDVEAGSYSRVLQELQVDLANPVVQNDPALKIRALSLKGTIDLNLNTVAAKDDFTQIRDLAKSLGDQKWQNRAVGELGVIAGVNGDIGAAGLALITAINKAAELHDLAAQLNFSVWLANGMAVNGMADRAVRVLDKAMEAASQNPDSGIPIQLQIARIRALVNLPDGPQRVAGIADAERLIEQSLASARKSNTLGAQAELLNQAGLLAQRKPDLTAAATYFSDTADIASRADLPRMRAETLYHLYHLCDVYKTQGKFTRAETAINSAIMQQAKAQEAFDLPQYLAEKVEVEVGLHRLATATDLYIRATALAESLLMNAPTSQVKSSMIDTMGSIYLGHFRLALLTMQSPAKAFEIVEYARGRALADSMRSRNGDRNSSPVATAADLEIAQVQNQLRQPSNTQAETKRLLARLDRAYEALAPVEYSRDRRVVSLQTCCRLPAAAALAAVPEYRGRRQRRKTMRLSPATTDPAITEAEILCFPLLPTPNGEEAIFLGERCDHLAGADGVLVYDDDDSSVPLLRTQSFRDKQHGGVATRIFQGHRGDCKEVRSVRGKAVQSPQLLLFNPAFSHRRDGALPNARYKLGDAVPEPLGFIAFWPEWLLSMPSKQTWSGPTCRFIYQHLTFETVVAPALSTHPTSVTIVPDGSLHLVPFASLRDQNMPRQLHRFTDATHPKQRRTGKSSGYHRWERNGRPADSRLGFQGRPWIHAHHAQGCIHNVARRAIRGTWNCA